jgi:GT2 family glycosyltransferase
MGICFVILHYQNIDVTNECIGCLREINFFDSCNVVVIDNASPNESGKQLIQKYNNCNNIHVLLNKENLGFAAGNNIGYDFARKKLRADQIIVMNNDILIRQKNFISKLKEEYNDSNVQLIAPDIVNLFGSHQNPFRTEPLSNKKLNIIHWYNLTLNCLYTIPIINSFLAKVLYYKSQTKKKNKYIEKHSLYNIVPHGSCIVYQGTWVKNEEYAFLPGTFMYFEEDILYEYLISKNYNLKYSPELCVNHVEDASVNASIKSELGKRKFIAKNLMKSSRVLILMRSKKNDFLI